MKRDSGGSSLGPTLRSSQRFMGSSRFQVPLTCSSARSRPIPPRPLGAIRRPAATALRRSTAAFLWSRSNPRGTVFSSSPISMKPSSEARPRIVARFAAAPARRLLAVALELVAGEGVVAAAGEQSRCRELGVEAGPARRAVDDEPVRRGLVGRLVRAEADVAVLAEHLDPTAEVVGQLLEQGLELIAHVGLPERARAIEVGLRVVVLEAGEPGEGAAGEAGEGLRFGLGVHGRSIVRRLGEGHAARVLAAVSS